MQQQSLTAIAKPWEPFMGAAELQGKMQEKLATNAGKCNVTSAGGGGEEGAPGAHMVCVGAHMLYCCSELHSPSWPASSVPSIQ